MVNEAMTGEDSQKKEVTATVVKKKGKRSFWKGFGTFLMMGGWMLILVATLGIIIAVSVLTSPK